MNKKNTWNEYTNNLKQFLFYAAKSLWAWYLFYPIGIIVAVMYTAGQVEMQPFSYFALFCDFVVGLAVVMLCAMLILACVFTFDYPYDRLRIRNKERDCKRILDAFRKQYDKEIEIRIQKENEQVRAQVISACQEQHESQLNEIRKKHKEDLENLQNEIAREKDDLKTNEIKLEHVQKESEEEISKLKKDIKAKKKTIEELENSLSDLQNSYNCQIAELKIKHEKEKEQLIHMTINELYTDEFKFYLELAGPTKEARNVITLEMSDKVKKIVTYAVMELAKFGFTQESYVFIVNKVRTFVEDGGKFDNSAPSPIINKFKNPDNVNKMKSGRSKKINTIDIVLTTQDIAHYTHNIATYLNFKLKDVAEFTEYLFKDWYPKGGQFGSIASSATKKPNDGLIIVHKNLEEYMKQQNWLDIVTNDGKNLNTVGINEYIAKFKSKLPFIVAKS